MSTSPENPNFYVCACQNVWSVFDLMCPICKQSGHDSRRATQQEVNDNADLLLDRSKTLSQARHQLPEQRRRPIPTREEFEAALDKLEKLGKPSVFDLNRVERAGLEMIVKRYKHHYSTH